MTPDNIALRLKHADKRGAARIALVPINADGSEADPLHTWDLDGEVLEDGRRAELATELYEWAQGDCDEYGHPRKYKVQISGRPAGTVLYSWNIQHRPAAAALNLQAEPGELTRDVPGNEGVVALALRHSERSVNLLLSSQEQVIRSLQHQNERLQKQVDHYQRREFDVAELYRRLAESTADTEAVSERIDRGMSLFSQAVAAVGVQMGVLPEGFSFDGDLAKLKQTILQASSTNGKALAASDGA